MTLSGNHSTKLSALTKETKSMIRLGNSAYYKLYTGTFWYTFYNMGLPFMLVMSIIVKSRDESSNQECFERLSIVGETCVFSNFVPKFKDLFLPSSNSLGSALEYYSLRDRNSGGASVAIQVRTRPRLRCARTMKDRALDDV